MSHCLWEADIPAGGVMQFDTCSERKNRGCSGVPGRTQVLTPITQIWESGGSAFGLEA